MSSTSVKVTRGALAAFMAVVLSGLASGTAHAQSLVAAVLPTSRSVQVGFPATAFATILNGGNSTATSCGIALGIALPATFHYQTTNPATNAPMGPPDTPANIPAGQSQTYSFVITPNAAFGATDLPLVFDCTNTSPVPTIPGVNTFLMSASITPVPDIVALAATIRNNGFVELDGAGVGAFALATVNVGVPGTITVTADTGAAALPVTFLLCRTQSGQCQQAPSVTLQIGSNETPTFSVFVFAHGSFSTDPAVNRAFVRFKDAAGVTRGSSSVAIKLPLPTTLAGTWRLSASGTARADNGDTDPFSLTLPPFAVTQSGNTLSGSVVSGDAEDILGILPPGCALKCGSPGSCSLTCPGLSCGITCTPATPLCGERLVLGGTVSGTALSISLHSNPSVQASCSGLANGTLFISETNVFNGTGTVVFSSTPTASGTFMGRTDQSCGGTGDFAGAIDCIGFSSSGTFNLSVTPASSIAAPAASSARPAVDALMGEILRRLRP